MVVQTLLKGSKKLQCTFLKYVTIGLFYKYSQSVFCIALSDERGVT